jgi:hypothetical protein
VTVERRPSVSNRERAIWCSLVALSLIWGYLAALAFYDSRFWLKPTTALFGFLAIGTLCTTMFLSAADRKQAAE